MTDKRTLWINECDNCSAEFREHFRRTSCPRCDSTNWRRQIQITVTREEFFAADTIYTESSMVNQKDLVQLNASAAAAVRATIRDDHDLCGSYYAEGSDVWFEGDRPIAHVNIYDMHTKQRVGFTTARLEKSECLGAYWDVAFPSFSQ